MSSIASIAPHEINGHKYVVVPHPTSEGIHFGAIIIGAAIGPLLNVFEAGIRSGKIKEGDALNMDAIMSMLDDVDLNALARDLSASLRSLSPADFAALFKYTRRDDQKLSDRAVFDSVYAGNYAEFYQAIAHIVQVNAFLPF